MIRADRTDRNIRSRPSTLRLLGSLITAAAVLGVLSACSASAVTVTASSSSPGTSAASLVSVAASVPEPPRAPAATVALALGGKPGPAQGSHTGDVTWQSAGPGKGAWVRLAWVQARQIDHIRIDGAGGSAAAYLNAVVTFSDGSSIFVTPDAAGNVSLDIAPRPTSFALLRFATVPGARNQVALRAFTVDDSARATRSPQSATVRASSHVSTSSAGALDDGDIANGKLGATWIPASNDAHAWVGYSWASAVTLASIQLAGELHGSANLGGVLVFSDGSRVKVAGVTSGLSPVTTVAFTPRVVRWVRFDPTVGNSIALSEFRAYTTANSPPRWPSAHGVSITSPPETACSMSTPAIGQVQNSALALVCPATGTSVGGTAVVAVQGPAGEKINAVTWMPGPTTTGRVSFLASAVLDPTGRALVSFPTARLPHGPMAIKFSLSDNTVAGSTVPLYVQLNNSGGVTPRIADYAPKGMTKQFDDEFDSPLSVSGTGAGATYAATKPIPGGGSEFGGAVFGNPDRGSDALATVNGNVLRLRVEPIGSGTDPDGYDRKYTGGLLSSLRVGGSGFSAQYGYYEARILAPAGRGSWPAFWMLDSQSATHGGVSYGEVDAFELYGHNTDGSCHSLYNWNTAGQKTNIDCLADNGADDWALSWHTYGVRIRPDGADYYIDGRQVATREGLVNDANPYYFMLDLEVDGGWPVEIDPTGGTLDMYVDWVRVYT